MDKLRVPFDDWDASIRLADALTHIPWYDTTIACIGTDRSTGDSFGPLVGARLQQLGVSVPVIGTLNEPLHAVNLKQRIEFEVHTRYILAIDACLGKYDHVGHIIFEDEPIQPGAGVKKNLPEVGDWSISGVVNVSGFMEYFVLQNTRLSIVMRMADIVADGIAKSIHNSAHAEVAIG